MSSMEPNSSAHAQRGFTFVEVAVVLTIVGLMTWAVTSAYANSTALRDRDRAVHLGEALREAVRAFALVHRHLPCPDTDGDGWAGGVGGACTVTVQAGGFPYRSLGLDVPDDRYRAAYLVYRRSSVVPSQDADLAVRQERTGNAPGDPAYQDMRDLIVALANAANDSPSTLRARLTGNDGTDGPVDCTLNVRSHPSFVLVLPLEARSANGSRFETPHAIGAACAWAPGTASTQARDDVVIAEPLTALSGWLTARAS
jgi:prepilin-type N-terminal cleavage/methylation domain-containing protein